MNDSTAELIERGKLALQRGDSATVQSVLGMLEGRELTTEQRELVRGWEARTGYDQAAIALTVIGGVGLLMIWGLIYL